MKTCPYCKKRRILTHIRAKTCGVKKCQLKRDSEVRKSKYIPKKRKCLFCEKEFELKKREKTCSRRCSKKRRIAWRREHFQIPNFKICIQCSKSFKPRTSAKTCSKECSDERYQFLQYKYMRNNKEIIRKKNAEYFQKNKEQIRKYRKKYREKNRKQILDRAKKYQEQPEVKKRIQEYRLKPEVIDRRNARNRIRNLKLYRENPVYRKKIQEKNKAQKSWRKHFYDLILAQNNLCAIGGQKLPNDPKYCHVDHIIPRSKGGSDELSNLQIACWKCNILKSDKILEESHAG